jgi:hypothetical protein
VLRASPILSLFIWSPEWRSFLEPSITLAPVCPDIFLGTLFLNILSLCHFLNTRRSFTPTQNKQNCIFVYCNICILQ